MSYTAVSTTPRLEPRPLRGALGTLIDANIATRAYYICLVQIYDNTLGLRSYQWSDYRYLTNWDALGFKLGYDKTLPNGYQTATLYEWTGTQWVRILS